MSDNAKPVEPAPQAAPDFFARAVPYSSVVGSSIMLTEGQNGKVIGQLALLAFGEQEKQEYWAQRLVRALNNGLKAEKAIVNFLARGMIKTSRDMPEGRGGPSQSTKEPVDARKFVAGLDKGNPGGKDDAAIRGDQKAP